ncbi:putative nuclease HARBI1 [Portunus trituberculatus]|uniref:putative nuclease HARBI1 n=1 Tax=Portunus trituberculatus TaxID=210409 RepID=UPI001E1CC59B|nr:putative nuclease HARBI1 [Portunus trituberculatus]
MYNLNFRAQKRTRCLVERGIGLLKRRFHALHGEIRLSPQKTCHVIIACAVLHNICKVRNINLRVDPEEEEAAAVINVVPPPEAHEGLAVEGLPQDGLRYRQHFTNLTFQNVE